MQEKWQRIEHDCVQRCLQPINTLQSNNLLAITIDEGEEMSDKIIITEQNPKKRELMFKKLHIKVDEFRRLIITDSKQRYAKL